LWIDWFEMDGFLQIMQRHLLASSGNTKHVIIDHPQQNAINPGLTGDAHSNTDFTC
jgi:hypothetical protein